MINKKVIIFGYLSFIIVGFFINYLAAESTSYQHLLRPIKINLGTIKGSIREVTALTSHGSQSRISENINFGSLSPDTTILRNHDGRPAFYYIGDSTYYVTRLTVPNYIASACTVKAIRFGLY